MDSSNVQIPKITYVSEKGVHNQKSDLDDDTKVLLKYAKGANKRRRILQALRFAPKNCNQLARELNSDWWTVQKHLQQLIRSDLVKVMNFGRIKFYKLTPKGELILKDALFKSREKE